MTGRERLSSVELAERVGQELVVTPWFAVDQDMINRFAELTGDDRVRFVVRVTRGSHIRIRVDLLELTRPHMDRVLMRYRTTIELRESTRPAVVAEMLIMAMLAGA